MSYTDFGLKDGDVGNSQKFRVFLDVREDGKTHKADLMKIKRGWWGSVSYVFQADLMMLTHKVEDEILAAELKLKKLREDRDIKEQEAINLIRRFEPDGVFEKISFVSRLKSKLKGKDDKPKTHKLEVPLVQNKKPPPTPSTKQKNANGQH